MELKLTIYKDEFCAEVDRVATADKFKLSLGTCEDVLNAINIDMFEGGLSALTEESQTELALGIIKNGFPLFKRLVKGIFKLTEEEIKNTDLAEIAVVVIEIVKYSFSQLAASLGGGKNSKN